MFDVAIVVFTLNSALCGLSQNLEMLVAARVLQGVGGAMMNPVGRLIVLRKFPKSSLLIATTYMTMPAASSMVAVNQLLTTSVGMAFIVTI